MKIEIKKVKHYCGCRKYVIMIDSEPILTTNKVSQANLVVGYINGADVIIDDKRLKKTLDSYRDSLLESRVNKSSNMIHDKELPSVILKRVNKARHDEFATLTQRCWRPTFKTVRLHMDTRNTGVSFTCCAPEYYDVLQDFPKYYFNAMIKIQQNLVESMGISDKMVAISDTYIGAENSSKTRSKLDSELNALFNDITNMPEILGNFIEEVLSIVKEREI